MSFRTRLWLLVTAAVVIPIALVTALIEQRMREAFELQEDQRTQAIVEQSQREFARRGDEVRQRVAALADSDAMMRVAVQVSGGDASAAVPVAGNLARANRLELLQIVADDGAIVSSAHWPARFGYKEDWLLAREWEGAPFLRREEFPDGPQLALESVRALRIADRKLYVAGGMKLGQEYLESLVLPAGMRAAMYRITESGFDSAQLIESKGPIGGADRYKDLIERARTENKESTQRIRTGDDARSDATVHALPLKGIDGAPLAILLILTPRGELLDQLASLRKMAMVVAFGGIIIGVILSAWAAARVTRPVEELANAAQNVADGLWDTRVEVRGHDELAQLAEAFNHMTRELLDREQRLVQSERVAAWRELARRLAHELKNPLFPLQITIENLIRAREQAPGEFDAVFKESTQTLLAELANMKAIIGRFSDFSKMPQPQLQPVDVNELVRGVVKLFEPQLAARQPAVALQLELPDALPKTSADDQLLHRALSNLLLNAMDAMPEGGTLTVRTAASQHTVRIEVADTGIGLTPSECERLFTPYYTSKQHGTGLGLAIVQSVISDHRGKITVHSEPQRGTTFRIELPAIESARGALA